MTNEEAIEAETRRMKINLARRNHDGLAKIWCPHCGGDLKTYCPNCDEIHLSKVQKTSSHNKRK